MKIHLDDQHFDVDAPDRNPGFGWELVSTVEEAKILLILNKGNVTHLSVDNDLGENTPEGYTLIEWLCEEWFLNQVDYWPKNIVIHSQNAVRRECMLAYIANPRMNPNCR